MPSRKLRVFEQQLNDAIEMHKNKGLNNRIQVDMKAVDQATRS